MYNPAQFDAQNVTDFIALRTSSFFSVARQ